MARVIVTKELEERINKKFKKESIKIFELLFSLKETPHKGKLLSQIGNIALKELRYKSFRFYFITDGYKLKFIEEDKLCNLLIKFIEMPNKKEQQETINKIKKFLSDFGKSILE
jgi:hypothetical protein